MAYDYSFYYQPPESKRRSLAVSSILHLLVFALVLASPYLFHRKRKVIATKFFQVVNVQIQQHNVSPKAKPKPKLQKPKPKVRPDAKPQKAPSLVAKVETAQPVLEEPEPEYVEPVQVAVADPDFQYDYYLAQVQNQIERQWNRIQTVRGIPGEETLELIVSFIITASGDIAELSLGKSSGSPLLDSNGLRCIRRAAPFPKLPIHYRKGLLRIHFTLRYLR